MAKKETKIKRKDITDLLNGGNGTRTHRMFGGSFGGKHHLDLSEENTNETELVLEKVLEYSSNYKYGKVISLKPRNKNEWKRCIRSLTYADNNSNGGDFFTEIYSGHITVPKITEKLNSKIRISDAGIFMNLGVCDQNIWNEYLVKAFKKSLRSVKKDVFYVASTSPSIDLRGGTNEFVQMLIDFQKEGRGIIAKLDYGCTLNFATGLNYEGGNSVFVKGLLLKEDNHGFFVKDCYEFYRAPIHYILAGKTLRRIIHNGKKVDNIPQYKDAGLI